MNLGYHSLKEADVEAAHNAWGFNCGPGALCGILGTSPEELRPFLGDFEQRRYMNPTLMRETLNRLRVRYRWAVMAEQSAAQQTKQLTPRFGLCRVQWGGPWCAPGVPMQARYRQTHWIAVATNEARGGLGVFDVNNNTGDGRIDWTPWVAWVKFVVPAILESSKRTDWTWWFTHVVEVRP